MIKGPSGSSETGVALRKIAVVGLGYVGLPVAVAFGRAGAPVIGFDINAERVNELQGRQRYDTRSRP